MSKRQSYIISTGFLMATISAWLYLPALTSALSLMVIIFSLATTIFIITKNHLKNYLQAECTREKMARNLSLDLIGLLLSMAAAIFAGGQAGQWAGIQAGLWASLAAGFLVGFLAAWVARSLWGRLIALV